MKIALKYILLVTAFGIVTAGCEYFSKPNLPNFDIVVLGDSLSIYNTGSIGKDSPVVLFYFSPECDHCQNQTDSILSNMESLRNVKFYFLSNDSLKIVSDFSKRRKMNSYPNIMVGLDKDGYFPQHYTPKGTPSIAIFNKSKQLKYMLDGGTDNVHELIRMVKELD